MFDHIGLKVTDLARQRRASTRPLAPLGHELGSQGDGYAGFGPPAHRRCGCMRASAAMAPARTWRSARAIWPRSQRFHAQRPEGRRSRQRRSRPAPGLQPDYYAAFLIDPDGHNVEAVCFEA